MSPRHISEYIWGRTRLYLRIRIQDTGVGVDRATQKRIFDPGRAFLEKPGYDVVTATGGQQAVETVKTKDSEVDLVILDMIMPVWMNEDQGKCRSMVCSTEV